MVTETRFQHGNLESDFTTHIVFLMLYVVQFHPNLFSEFGWLISWVAR